MTLMETIKRALIGKSGSPPKVAKTPYEREELLKKLKKDFESSGRKVTFEEYMIGEGIFKSPSPRSQSVQTLDRNLVGRMPKKKKNKRSHYERPRFIVEGADPLGDRYDGWGQLQ